jgi:hypothetical protein
LNALIQHHLKTWSKNESVVQKLKISFYRHFRVSPATFGCDVMNCDQDTVLISAKRKKNEETRSRSGKGIVNEDQDSG